MDKRFIFKRRFKERILKCNCCGNEYLYDEYAIEPGFCVNCQDPWWRKDD